MGGKLVFYKTNFPLNKIGFVICDKCNEEFYAPKVEFSDESYGQKRHSCSNFDKENIKDNLLHTKPSPTDHQLEGKVLKKEGCAR